MQPEDRLEQAAEHLRAVRKDDTDSRMLAVLLYRIEVKVRGHAAKYRQGRAAGEDAEVVE